MQQETLWWLLFDRKGNLYKSLPRDRYDLNEAIAEFKSYAQTMTGQEVEIHDIEEIYKQG